MIGRNFIVKNAKKFFLNILQKIPLENSLSLPRNSKKMISLDYHVNDHVDSKSKSV